MTLTTIKNTTNISLESRTVGKKQEKSSLKMLLCRSTAYVLLQNLFIRQSLPDGVSHIALTVT